MPMLVVFVCAVSFLIVATALEKLWRVAKSVTYWTLVAGVCVSLGVVTVALIQALPSEPMSMLALASPWVGFLVAAGTFLMIMGARSRAMPRRVSVSASHSPRAANATASDRTRTSAQIRSVSHRPRFTLKQALSYWSQDARRARVRAQEDACRAVAWDKLQAEVDWASSQVAVARRSCETFLAASDGSTDFAVISFAVALRKRIPEIVDEVGRACVYASPSERRAMLDETIDNIERLGAVADRFRRTLTMPMNANFPVTRAYVEQLTRRGQPLMW